MPSRYLNRRRSEATAGGHLGNYGRVAAFNDCNTSLGRTGTPGHERSSVGWIWMSALVKPTFKSSRDARMVNA